MEKLFIDREDDRLAVVSILAKNGYTVMIGRQKRPNKSKNECYVGYEPGPSTPADMEKGAADDH